MKKKYFSTETIQEKSDSMFQDLGRLRKENAFLIGQSALLVLDMQDYFLHPASHAHIPSGRSIIPGIQRLIAVFEEAARPIIFTRHINTFEDAGSMARWWRDVITEDHPLSRITSVFDTSPGLVLQKSQYDAFYNTDLEKTLKENDVARVVITGVMTHLCCETTARSAFVRGFDVFFVVDGTATYNEDHHRAALMNLSHGFATPVLVKDIIGAQSQREKI